MLRNPSTRRAYSDVVVNTVVPFTVADEMAANVQAVVDFEKACEAVAAEEAVKAVVAYEARERKKLENREKKIYNICELISYLSSLPTDESASIAALQNELEKELLKD